jgi:hypothetical protein
VGSETQLTVFWARASSGAMAAPTVADLGNHQLGEILTVRGCIASGDPWDVTAGDVQSTATTAVSVPGATTTVSDCLVVMIASNGFDTDIAQTSGWANPDLANVTERGDINTALGHGGGFGFATGEKAAVGAYGATTATLAGASQQGRLSIALRPPVASSTAPPWVEPMEAESDWVDPRWVTSFDVS